MVDTVNNNFAVKEDNEVHTARVERQFGAHWSWSGTGFGDRAGDTFIDVILNTHR